MGNVAYFSLPIYHVTHTNTALQPSAYVKHESMSDLRQHLADVHQKADVIVVVASEASVPVA